MGTNLGSAAYQGFLRNDSATIAEALRPAGYRTMIAGKWHVGGDFLSRDYDDWRPGEIDHPSPRQRGFDRFYGIHDGATHFFSVTPKHPMGQRVFVSFDVSPVGYLAHEFSVVV